MKALCVFFMLITVTRHGIAQSSIGALAVGLNMRKAAITSGIRPEAYDKVIRYYSKYYNQIENKKVLSFIDFSQPSSKKRFYVVDLSNGKISKYLVAHGKLSGELYATDFSNKPESKKSSLGLFKVQEEYRGKHGPSLRMDGLEATNSNARMRSIVMHAANYVSPNVVQSTGRLGRSWGCPALSPNDWTAVRPLIRSGSILLAYR